MPIVTFLSDFGTKDHYVAAVKAVLYRQEPTCQIIDINHNIEVCNIMEAAYVLKSLYQDFPKGTIHLLGVGTSLAHKGRFLAVLLHYHIFVLPDNGLLNLISEQKPSQIIALTNSQKEAISFPTKTVLAPAIAQLLQGISVEKLGKKTSTIYKSKEYAIAVSEKTMKGDVIYIDGSGNAITNIEESVFFEARKERRFIINFTREKFKKIHKSYQDGELGDCVIFFNSNGMLEIAINQGNASELLGLKYGSSVLINFS